MVKKIPMITMMSLILASAAIAQPDTLRLDECYMLAKSLSPLKKQELLNDSIFDLNIENRRTNYLPSVSLNGKATYQSEVISIPGTGMIQDYPQIPKEQFQVSLDISQNLYDGGLTRNSKELEESSWILARSKLETELYSIQSTINELYFSILQLQENANVLHTSLETLENQQKIISFKVREGVILENNLNQINKQILTLQQDILSVEADRNAQMAILSMWIGQPVRQETILSVPDFEGERTITEIKRPENTMFQARRSFLESQRSLVNVENAPKFSAFAQGGVGQPNPVNFFEVDPSTYYLLGLRMNWPIFNWGNSSRQKQVYALQQDILNTEESDFDRNIRMVMTRLYANAGKLEAVIKKDEEIIDLQEKIVRTAFFEFQNGVINSTDYLTEMNALTEAEIKRSIHKIKLAETHATIYTVSGQEF